MKCLFLHMYEKKKHTFLKTKLSNISLSICSVLSYHNKIATTEYQEKIYHF